MDLESVRSHVPSSYPDGSASLRDLSDAFSAVHFDGDNVREEAKKVGWSSDQFYVPSRREGQILIKRKLEALNMLAVLKRPYDGKVVNSHLLQLLHRLEV